jgi:hypothetical protein
LPLESLKPDRKTIIFKAAASFDHIRPARQEGLLGSWKKVLLKTFVIQKYLHFLNFPSFPFCGPSIIFVCLYGVYRSNFNRTLIKIFYPLHSTFGLQNHSFALVWSAGGGKVFFLFEAIEMMTFKGQRGA